MKQSDESYNRLELERLLADEPSKERSELIALWDQLDGMSSQGEIDDVREDAVLTTIIHQAKATPHMQRPMRLVSRPLVKYSVAATLMFMLVSGWYYLVPTTRIAPPGQIVSVRLPDASSVELNSGSSIRYRRYFGDRRGVELAGEAYFDIQKSSKPFTVETFNASIHVLGTSFNVKSWDESLEAVTTVTLLTGSVELETAGSSVIMLPGDIRTVDSGTSIQTPSMGMAAALSWRDGDLVYANELLGVVLEDVQRRFGTRIHLFVDDLAERRMSLSFHNPDSAESVIRDICGAYSLSYRRTSDGFEIYKSN